MMQMFHIQVWGLFGSVFNRAFISIKQIFFLFLTLSTSKSQTKTDLQITQGWFQVTSEE